MSNQASLAERRRSSRRQPAERIRVVHAVPVVPLSDARVINISSQGVAIQTRAPLHPGERLSFLIENDAPPVLAEVLACETDTEAGFFRIRCKCLLGGFDQ